MLFAMIHFQRAESTDALKTLQDALKPFVQAWFTVIVAQVFTSGNEMDLW